MDAALQLLGYTDEQLSVHVLLNVGSVPPPNQQQLFHFSKVSIVAQPKVSFCFFRNCSTSESGERHPIIQHGVKTDLK